MSCPNLWLGLCIFRQLRIFQESILGKDIKQTGLGEAIRASALAHILSQPWTHISAKYTLHLLQPPTHSAFFSCPSFTSYPELSFI